MVITCDMIAEKLKCSKCNRYLSAPVMSNGNLNFCSNCYTDQKYFKSNALLESFMMICEKEGAVLPCQYRKNGCLKLLNYSSLNTHINQCVYQLHACPFSTNCEKVSSIEFLEHLKEFHLNLLMKTSNPVFTIVVNHEDKNLCRAVQVQNDLFILKIEIRGAKLSLAVCSVYSIQKSCKVLLKQYLIDTTLVQNKEIHVEQFNHLNSMTDCESLILSLPEWDDDIQIPALLTLEVIGDQKYHLPSEIDLKSLECPVCKEFFMSHIFICESGHSICETCKENILFNKCPLCKLIIRGRNLNLESVCSAITFPCSNNISGCSIFLPGSLMSKHIEECDFRSIDCYVGECNWSGVQTLYGKHLTNNHTVSDSCLLGENCTGVVLLQDKIHLISFDKENETLHSETLGQVFICYQLKVDFKWYDDEIDINLGTVTSETRLLHITERSSTNDCEISENYTSDYTVEVKITELVDKLQQSK